VEFDLMLPASEMEPRACGCDYCAPNGSAYLGSPRCSLQVRVQHPGLLYAHNFGSRTADFMHCARCNTAMYVLSRIDGKLYALASANVVRDELPPARPVDLSGETLAQRLKRRQQCWIPEPEVIIHDQTT
jgi:hypothetical protein